MNYQKLLAKILSLVVLAILVIGAISCTSRSRKYHDAMEAKVELPDGSSHMRLSIEKIGGHEYALYDAGQFGISMVHHAGCKASHTF